MKVLEGKVDALSPVSSKEWLHSEYPPLSRTQYIRRDIDRLGRRKNGVTTGLVVIGHSIGTLGLNWGGNGIARARMARSSLHHGMDQLEPEAMSVLAWDAKVDDLGMTLTSKCFLPIHHFSHMIENVVLHPTTFGLLSYRSLQSSRSSRGELFGE